MCYRIDWKTPRAVAKTLTVLSVCCFAALAVANARIACATPSKPVENQEDTMNTTAVETQDIDGIHKAVLEYYIGGGKSANVAEFKKAFHEAATIYGYGQGKMTGGPIQLLFDIVAKSEPAKNLRAEIVRMDITGGQVAQVKAEAYDWNGARYTDMFNLIKESGQWKIVSKIYYAR